MQGINLAFTTLLLQHGCSVVLADLVLLPAAQALLDQYPPLPSSTPTALFHKTDVSSWSQLSSLFGFTVENLGCIDILCPGAGVFEPEWSSFWHPPGTASSLDVGGYKLLDINLVHPMRMVQMGIEYWLREKREGRVVCVGSIAGQLADVGSPMYHARCVTACYLRCGEGE